MARQVFFMLDADIEQALAERYPDMKPGTAVRHYLRETLGGSSRQFVRRDELDEIIRDAMRGQGIKGDFED